MASNEQIHTLNIPAATVYDDGTCAICMGPHENKSHPSCGHVFCFECLVEWCRIRQICPMCNRPITSFKHSFDSENNYQVHHCPSGTPRMDQNPRFFLMLFLFVCFLYFIGIAILTALYYSTIALLFGSFLARSIMFVIGFWTFVFLPCLHYLVFVNDG